MSKRQLLTRSLGALLAIIAASVGCGDGSVQSPAGPSPVVGQVGPPPVAQNPTGLEVTSIEPNTGGTAGATLVRITGAHLQRATRVTFAGVPATRVGWSPDGTVVSATTPPGVAGTVDVVVTNSTGLGGTLPGGFTYGAAAPLSVTNVSPTTGAAAGGTYVTFRGTGFQSGAKVTFDGVDTMVLYQLVATDLQVFTRPHLAGGVDVVVTNPDGHVARIASGFTYTRPTVFDFNGDWVGHLGHEGEVELRFTIENDALVRVTCQGNQVTFPVTTTRSGDFSFDTGGRLGMTGALLRADYAEGTVNIAACGGYDTVWSAKRQ